MVFQAQPRLPGSEDGESVSDDVGVSVKRHLLVQNAQLDNVGIGRLVFPILDQEGKDKDAAVSVGGTGLAVGEKVNQGFEDAIYHQILNQRVARNIVN